MTDHPMIRGVRLSGAMREALAGATRTGLGLYTVEATAATKRALEARGLLVRDRLSAKGVRIADEIVRGDPSADTTLAQRAARNRPTP